jgi:hypothetical protein
MKVCEASKKIGITMGNVYILLESGRLPAKRIDGRWDIDEKDLTDYRATHGHKANK